MSCICLCCLLPLLILLVHVDFQPKLMMENNLQSVVGSFSTLNYTAAGYTEGIAKYPNCANQFTVNFSVTPVANISSVTTGDVRLYHIINLKHCTIYETFASSFRGGQLQDTVYTGVSVMISKLCVTCFIFVYVGIASNSCIHMHASSYLYIWSCFTEIIKASI